MEHEAWEEESVFTKDNRIARKSTIQPPSASSTYSTRRQAARNASKAISASSFEKSMESFNPDMSQREKRKISKKFNPPATRRPAGSLYDEKGIHIATGLDLCDCLTDKCPGCWFECPKCKSRKCGPECRVFRKYMVDYIEFHGYDKTIKNSFQPKTVEK